MLEDFKELLKELEPKLGKYKAITAYIEDVQPKNDNGTYTESKVWVELENQWLLLYEGPNKWGEIFTGSGLSKSKPETIWDLEDIDFDLEEKLSERGIDLYIIAEEIFSKTHLQIERLVNLENILQEDIDYLEEQLINLKNIKDVK